MTTQISGDTGVSQCQPNSVSQDDLQGGVVGKGPAFRASTTNQGTVNGTLLLQLSEEIDTANAYSAGRFTPPVAGYYQVSGSYRVNAVGGALTYAAIQLKKNGSVVLDNGNGPYISTYGSASLSGLIYLNGTTDYIELWQDISVTGNPLIVASSFSAALVRAA